MNNLFSTHSAVAPALLEALLHSLWIGGILYLFLRAYLDLAAAHVSASRYRVSVFALLIQVLLTIIIFVSVYHPDASHAFHRNWSITAGDFPGSLQLADQVTVNTGSRGTLREIHLPDIALCAYLSGVLFFFMRMLIASTHIRRRIGMASVAAPKYLQLLERTRTGLGIRRHIRLVISDHMQSPALYGYFRPVIIVPAGMLTHLTFEQVEVILLHELIHLKKADFLINLFQQIVESLLFFNPFTWMISGLIREEREKRVDDAVTVQCNSATYAKALFNLSLLHGERPAAMMAANGGGQKLLLKRIQRILKVNHMKKEFKSRFYLSAIVAAGVIVFISLSGFSSSLLQIDRQKTKAVRSVQGSAPGEPDGQSVPGQQATRVPAVSMEIPLPEHVVVETAASKAGVATAAANTGVAAAVKNAAVVPLSAPAAMAAAAARLAGIPGMDEPVVYSLPGKDTLTEKERRELMKELERAREELKSIDWDQEMAKLEEERQRILEELPKLLEEEQQRIREELSKVDKEQVREQMEQARQQLESARQQLESTKQQIELDMQQQMQQLEQQLQSSEFHDEKTREAMERSLQTLREIDLEKMMVHLQEAMSDLDMDIDFDHDMNMDIDFDSIRISVRENLQEIDLEEIKADIDRSIKEIETRMEELKSSDTKKNKKN